MTEIVIVVKKKIVAHCKLNGFHQFEAPAVSIRLFFKVIKLEIKHVTMDIR